MQIDRWRSFNTVSRSGCVCSRNSTADSSRSSVRRQPPCLHTGMSTGGIGVKVRTASTFMRSVLVGLILGMTLGLSACSGDNDGNDILPDPDQGNDITIVDSNNSGGDPTTDDCSVASLNKWVDDNMRDYYYFYDQVPVVNLADYTSPESLITDLRVQPYDDFSYITERTSQQSFFNEGKSFGFGFRWKRDTAGGARIARIYPDSPMGRAGINRGDIINSVGGVGWDALTSEQFVSIVGTTDNPLASVWNVTDLDSGESRDVSLTMTEFTLNTVLERQVISMPDYASKIGYLLFSAFLETSAEELDDAFSEFRTAGIDELILDMRYNGGGLVKIALKLASLIAGTQTEGKLLTTYRYNDKYSNSNFSYQFEPEAQALALSRIVVLTTGSTASSSELVMNALSPYIEVVGVGTRTRGKPYSTRANVKCTKSMNAISAEGFNANDVSVYGGIAAQCGAVDNPIHRFGLAPGQTDLDGVDQMLAQGLRYITAGQCDVPVSAVAQRTRAEPIQADPALDPVGAFDQGLPPR